jgi:hypothetical protein
MPLGWGLKLKYAFVYSLKVWGLRIEIFIDKNKPPPSFI